MTMKSTDLTDERLRDERTGITLASRATIGVAVVAVAAQLGGCNSAGGQGAQGDESHSAHAARSEGGGQGEATAGAELVADDAAYLTQLGLIRGHLRVGYQLYADGLPALAETHMKHPRAEIYASIEPAFAARGCSGFGAQLSGLSNAVSERAELAVVTSAYERVVDGIAACESDAATNDPAVIAKVIENLLRTAGVEYQVGVIDGEIDNLHEYQDAWGFTQIADVWARSSAFSSPAAATAVAAQLQDVIAGLHPLWPSLDPQGGIDGKAAALFGAAGKVEVAALSLSR